MGTNFECPFCGGVAVSWKEAETRLEYDTEEDKYDERGDLIEPGVKEVEYVRNYWKCLDCEIRGSS